MGWDAFAIVPPGEPYAGEPVYDFGRAAERGGREVLAEDWRLPGAAEAFAIASRFVVDRCGGVDYLLARGGLDVTEAGIYLGVLVTGRGDGAWVDGPWTPEKIRAAAKIFPSPPEDADWLYWSARAFAETCAQLGLGMRFSY